MGAQKSLFIVPKYAMEQYVENVLNEAGFDIPVAQGVLQSAVNLVREQVPQGLEVVIARAGTLQAIQNANLGVAVVELPITGFDLIHTIDEAKVYGSRIAVVAYQSMVLGIESVAKVFGVELGYFFIKQENEIGEIIKKVVAEGYNVVLGGAVTAAAAQANGLSYVFINSSRESILQAAFEAERVKRAIEIEKYKHEMFSSVVSYSHDGIITVDHKGYIASMNPRALQITNFTQAVGKLIYNVWPELYFDQLMKSKKQVLGQIIRVNGMQVLCNKVPIIVDERPLGAVVTFQDVTRIQQLEASIRREIYAKGHIARFTFDDIWGDSLAIQRAVRTAKDYAATEANILIQGETGTGKEVFAQSIHNYSSRKDGPFVAVNCAALPSQLLESELFGYVKGAFTGANKEGKQGLFEMAHGGTLFLDEIGELDYVNQGQLLRVLQEKAVVRLGSDRVVPVNVRVIAATNKDLSLAVAEKKFRDDLYYRLNVLAMTLPPLRDRKADVRVYANKFLERFSPTNGGVKSFRTGALRLMEKFSWPGNVRQLQNTIQRVAVLCKEPIVSEAELSRCLDMKERKEKVKLVDGISQEIEQIRQALAQANGKQTQAANLLGINRSTLWRRMERLGLH